MTGMLNLIVLVLCKSWFCHFCHFTLLPMDTKILVTNIFFKTDCVIIDSFVSPEGPMAQANKTDTDFKFFYIDKCLFYNAIHDF